MTQFNNEIIGSHIESSDKSYLVEMRKNQRLDLRKNGEIAYLKKGSVSVHRAEDSLLTFTIKAPAVIGIAQMMHNNVTHFFRCSTNCSLSILDIESAVELFSVKQLWDKAYELLTNYIHCYFARENFFHKENVKEMVTEYLNEIWSLDESERNISVYTYILNRSNISRSAIHKSIADLISSGYITVQRGRLVNINK